VGRWFESLLLTIAEENRVESEGEPGEETMDLPFTAEQFLGVFEEYNRAIWPLQVVAYILGGTAILVTLRPRPYSDQMTSGVLVVLWMWTGLVYHALLLAAINPIATLFGAAFVGQAAIWAFEGVMAWSLVGVSAAASLGIVEDFALPVAAILVTALLSGPDHPPTPLGHWRRGYAR
jgi:hypothetical protein